MSILELLTMTLIICSNPNSGCKVIEEKDTNNVKYVICVDNPSPSSSLPSFDLGVIDMNNPEEYRYITIQPISCIEV